MKYIKYIAAGLSATILTAGAIAGASAQELVPLPGFNMGGLEQTQSNNGSQNNFHGEMSGQRNGQPYFGKMQSQRKDQLASLGFEEKQEKILANMAQREKHLNEMLAKVASAKESIKAATSDEELKEILKELRPGKRRQKQERSNSKFGQKEDRQNGNSKFGHHGGRQNQHGFEL